MPELLSGEGSQRIMVGSLQPMSLARHVRERDWEGLEEAWNKLMLEDAAPEPALDALRAAAEAREIARCLPFVRDHAELLAGGTRAAAAAELLGTAMLSGGSPGELARALWQAAEKAYGTSPTWETFCTISGLAESAPDMRVAWRAFRKLLSFDKGRVVYHAKGWGLGAIESIDHAAGEIRVRFQSGRSDRFPFASAIDIFEVLEPDDLRALVMTDPAALQRRLSKEPLEVLRWVLRRQNGRANHGAIKLALGTLGLEGTRFSAWWRKARKEAETSPWFEISGPATRAQVRLLDEATDPAEGLRRALLRSGNLGEALTRVRDLVGGAALGQDVAQAALATLAELAEDAAHPLERRLAVWLFLREKLGETPVALRVRIERAAASPEPDDPARAPALWELFNTVPGLRDQERCIELLRETVGEEAFHDAAARQLPHAAPGMVRSLIETLDAAGRREALVEHYGTLLARPNRAPIVLIELAGHLEPGPFPERLPRGLQRAQCLLQLAVQLERAAATDTVLQRARTRLSQVLTRGTPPMLRQLLQRADRDTLRGLAQQLETGVEREIDRVFTRVAVELAPNVFRGDERPFWETGGTWTTRRGLTLRESELRELREVKIPANSEAIGVAASYGDLSENSEWEAAIEEQRNLTNRAMELEAEIRDAQLIENAAVPEGVVAPGTAVVYRAEGREHRIRILGPWDAQATGATDVVSYRSPLAAGMLGGRAGTRAKLELPTGTAEVDIVSVETLPL